MKSEYKFKRNFYYAVEKAISESSVTFLLGARRCGKTVCLKQLQDKFSAGNEFDEVSYVDTKRELASTSDKSLFINEVRKAVENNEKNLFLIDEVTYLNQPDCAIMDVQDAFTSFHNTNTKVVFTGNPSRALECWGHRAFAGDAIFIRTDFLSYPEWLAFKGMTEVSEETYERFVRGTREFYSDFHGTKEYLQDCLDETAVSNSRAAELILNNDCGGLNADKLSDVLHASLVSSLGQKHLQDTVTKLSPEEITERYGNYQDMSAYELRRALQFLHNCGLITITYVSSSFDVKPYVVQDFLNEAQAWSKPEILKNLNISIKYPMFYVDLLENILKERFSEKLPENLLGRIAENHVRAILPDTGCFKYRDPQGREIDYVRKNTKKAIDILVENKKLSSTHFDVLPDGYEKILLTKGNKGKQGDIECVPYYQFIYDNSEGRELVNIRRENGGEKT